MEIREIPYGNFNFLVDLGTGNTVGPVAGFTEIALPDAEVDIFEFRNGNEKSNTARLLPGRVHYGTVTLKRGLIGSADLYQWFEQVKHGGPDEAKRTVVISLQSEDHSQTVFTWTLVNALPASYKFGALNATGREVAVEYLELAFEDFQVE